MSRLQFCQLCSNLMYSKEDVVSKTLKLYCKNCEHETSAQVSLIHSNVIKGGKIKITKESIPRDIVLDPTMPHVSSASGWICPYCGWHDAVFFQATDDQMRLYFVCANDSCREICKQKVSEGNFIVVEEEAEEDHDDIPEIEYNM